MANGAHLSRPGCSYCTSKLLKELLMVRLERMVWFVFVSSLSFFFLVCLFFKMLSRCQEALLYTTPGPRALKPNGTNSKEILFPVPPAGLGTFCSKAALTLWVSVKILGVSVAG